MHKNWQSIVSALECGERSVEDVLASLNYGIEIEFSELGGLSGPGECPYEESDAEERLNDNAIDTLANVFGEHHASAYSVYRQMLRCTDLETIVESCSPHSWSSLVDDELDSMRESWESEDENGYFEVDGWSHCPDGTASIEQEYKTDHPCNLEQMTERVKTLFRIAGGDAHVPLDGSCHVHVSVPGVSHRTNTSDGDNSYLHCCILYELAAQAENIPRCVYDRIDNDSHWFCLDGGPNEKYTAVRFHPQGSIEFRLFGHTNSARDALQCVHIAGTAFLRGYLRYFSKQYDIEDVSEFRDKFKAAIESGEPMSSDDIAPYMPMTGVLSAMCNVYDQLDEIFSRSRLSAGHGEWVSSYQHPWLTDFDMLWNDPAQYECELRDGGIIRLRPHTTDDGLLVFIPASAGESDDVYAYGPAMNGPVIWSDTSPHSQDIMRFRNVTPSTDDGTIVSPAVNIIAGMSSCSMLNVRVTA